MTNNNFNTDSIEDLETDDSLDENLAEFFYRELTEEEIKERKEKYTKEILEKVFLTPNKEYDEVPYAPMETVEKNPKRFIIEECIPACKELWKKNIYTFMVSDYLNEGCCWIEIIFDNLSDKNKEIYENLEGQDIIKFSYHKDAVNFGVKFVGKQGQQMLLELAQQFKMQDVPYNEAYITLPEYLISCGCYDEIENPNYIDMESIWIKSFSMNLTIEQKMEISKKYKEWENSNNSKKTIKLFNSQKMTKTLEEYLAETGSIYEEDRIYLNNYHYQKHINYINSQKNKPHIKLKI